MSVKVNPYESFYDHLSHFTILLKAFIIFNNFSQCFSHFFQCQRFNLIKKKHFLDFQVSWIRRKDYHLLTVGSTTYTGDERFSALHQEESEVCFLYYPSRAYLNSFMALFWLEWMGLGMAVENNQEIFSRKITFFSIPLIPFENTFFLLSSRLFCLRLSSFKSIEAKKCQ